ncbi:TPA: triphosphoribosyl-dephospho-CoA synthase CitG [Klebsiella aerogenes]|uniref:triphosphoribosyl-dephospho-CoA synthase CitG n=1 Tax=Klebsiella aerogenes TaxID=548 RepID=UPI0007B341A3|nr:triphosphoribosyl-dephospho-CoA synthase CitG [Klebsiella aerogenes]EKW1039267.1 triphosphoribosyl-dephospho-CoA synthase CitG [Klebsiella aerogenes]ELA1690658.1 triphosphoribosyl-dephospho-CoA synthase CitG [Klebsiella aerogenes]ELW9545665.1 triphosphoribosyl-dephospho-CoA synthase CitG [Klebsiella aerogenes]KZR15879.1 triphosphoribosyl-dephospho-CoA synthase [Klebsiella aerogenes]MEC5622064.1 triphosphoribosyl-dephospho-CoA synthase CitG [Klebsiella aerogenes]
MIGSLAVNNPAIDIPTLAEEALYRELDLTPKPGLVDRANTGSHQDMDHRLFEHSIAAISPWLRTFAQQGMRYADLPCGKQLRLLRPFGIACEQAMLRATKGVNTHKGGIFSLGLLCFTAGRLQEQGRFITSDTLCREVSLICQGLVAQELAGRDRAVTAGERQFRLYGLRGARGEAESGFATVRHHVLPSWTKERGERQLHHALLNLMAVNPDSNLVSRGGIAGMRFVQNYAKTLLIKGWDEEDLAIMDEQLISRNLSPGGSADLLSVAWVLASIHHYPQATL